MILHELLVLRPIDERASNFPHVLRSEIDTISALLPFFLSPPCIDEKGRRVRTKNAPFRSEPPEKIKKRERESMKRRFSSSQAWLFRRI